MREGMELIEGIKRRLIHFKTDGASVVSDFVAARQKRAGILRRTVHACFYVQCAAALTCAVLGFSMGGAVTGIIVTLGAAASAAAAFMAVSGGFVIRTISYVLNLVYAVICFIIGGELFTACGIIMLISSAAALISFAAGYFREFLLEYSPLKLTPEDYTLIGGGVPPRVYAPEFSREEERPVIRIPEPKSELMLIAEQVTRIMNTPPEPPEPPEQPAAQNAQPVQGDQGDQNIQNEQQKNGQTGENNEN